MGLVLPVKHSTVALWDNSLPGSRMSCCMMWWVQDDGLQHTIQHVIIRHVTSRHVMSPSVYPSLSGRRYGDVALPCPDWVLSLIDLNGITPFNLYLILSYSYCITPTPTPPYRTVHAVRSLLTVDMQHLTRGDQSTGTWNDVMPYHAIPCHAPPYPFLPYPVPLYPALSSLPLFPPTWTHPPCYDAHTYYNSHWRRRRMKDEEEAYAILSLDRYHSVLYIHSTAVRYSTPSYFPLSRR